MYVVLCTSYSVRRTLYVVLCTSYTVVVHCTSYIICTSYSVRRTLYVRRTVYVWFSSMELWIYINIRILIFQLYMWIIIDIYLPFLIINNNMHIIYIYIFYFILTYCSYNWINELHSLAVNFVIYYDIKIII